MITKCKPFKVLCWLCVGLALSTCTYDACLAQSTDEQPTPDSLDVKIENLRTGDLHLYPQPGTARDEEYHRRTGNIPVLYL